MPVDKKFLNAGHEIIILLSPSWFIEKLVMGDYARPFHTLFLIHVTLFHFCIHYSIEVEKQNKSDNSPCKNILRPLIANL